MELALATQPHLRSVPSQRDETAPDADDAELLVRVAEHDRIAFELLYHRYVRSVFGLALRRLRDRGRAEDAVQEVFASIWRSAGSYRPERGPATPWIYGLRPTVSLFTMPPSTCANASESRSPPCQPYRTRTGKRKP